MQKQHIEDAWVSDIDKKCTKHKGVGHYFGGVFICQANPLTLVNPQHVIFKAFYSTNKITVAKKWEKGYDYGD